MKKFDKKIIAIGGHVIKTAYDELRTVIEQGKVEMLIHNGGSIFHDFQRPTDEMLEDHSYPIDKLMLDYSCNEPASRLVWDWIEGKHAPKGSITRLCDDMNIDVLLFTGQACDYWQLFGQPSQWSYLGVKAFWNYRKLLGRFEYPFHYICMGSAVIHPEVFIKAISEAQPKEFIADVVDFLDMYRPRTRVAQFGTYYKMTHKEFLSQWITK
jgi:hypothetical protein